jgi:tRNA pseudouridine-54 N-methylase
LITFLLLVKNLTAYSKSDIDKGKTPLEIYELCSCIRESFCLSYSIRKGNNLYLYFQNEQILIHFIGEKLRYLGPDERSQALLLKKAINLARQYENLTYKDWLQSTPGIFVRGFKNSNIFYTFLNSILREISYLLLDNEIDSLIFNNQNLGNLTDLLFIIPTYTISKDNSDVFGLFQKLKNIKCKNLSKIEGIENKILYINFQIDQQIYYDSQKRKNLC